MPWHYRLGKDTYAFLDAVNRTSVNFWCYRRGQRITSVEMLPRCRTAIRVVVWDGDSQLLGRGPYGLKAPGPLW